MGYPVDERHGLTLAFTDFHLLPEMLARVPGSQGPGIPRSWHRLLSEFDYNMDHLENDEDADLEDDQMELAMDAWRLAIGLELVSEEGLTRKGIDLAQLAEEPREDRTADNTRFLRETLAEQILECYLGESISIATVLQEGAKRVADSQWAEYCPGLLLIEVQALIGLSHREPKRFVSWSHDPDDLVAARTEAMRVYGMPGADLDVFEAMLDDPDQAARLQDRVDHADAVTYFYYQKLELSGMTIAEVRSTAMLLTFAGLLEERFSLGPVHCLTAPSER